MARGKLISRLAIALAIIAGLALFWDEHAKHDLIPKRFHEVVPERIYRSGMLTPASTRTVVERHDIRTIVDLGAWEPDSPEDRLAEATARELGVKRIVFDPAQYLDTLRIMNDPVHPPILVPCGAGTERTGCAVILYRNIIEGVPVDVAYEEAERVGHSPRRNPHLREVLDRWHDPIADAFDRDTELGDD